MDEQGRAGVNPFNEETLKADIVRTWGAHGAHADVFDQMVKECRTLRKTLLEVIEELEHVVPYMDVSHHNDRGEDDGALRTAALARRVLSGVAAEPESAPIGPESATRPTIEESA